MPGCIYPSRYPYYFQIFTSKGVSSMRLKSLILSLTVVGAMALPLLYTAPAQAQASRTWVSGVGDDANPCSRTAPCKTFAGAISKTANGGEIDALDPGGFGAVTITKSITLDGGGGQVASILVAGTNGVNVSAQPTDVVIIKNIRFQGLLGNGSNSGNAGITAIKFNSGLRLIVENCEIYGFNTNGIDIASNTAGNFTAINNTQIMNVGNAGIIAESSVASSVEIDEARIYVTKFGVSAANLNGVLLSRSVSSKASTEAVHADSGGTVVLDNNVISFSTIGIGGAGTIQSFNNNKLVGASVAGGTTVSKIGSQSDPFGMQ